MPTVQSEMLAYEGAGDREPVLEAVRALIAEAIPKQGMIEAEREAARIARHFPDCGMSAGEVAETILQAAIAARVPVAFGHEH